MCCTHLFCKCKIVMYYAPFHFCHVHDYFFKFYLYISIFTMSVSCYYVLKGLDENQQMLIGLPFLKMWNK